MAMAMAMAMAIGREDSKSHRRKYTVGAPEATPLDHLVDCCKEGTGLKASLANRTTPTLHPQPLSHLPLLVFEAFKIRQAFGSMERPF